MKMKIISIFVCMLMFVTVFSVTGTENILLKKEPNNSAEEILSDDVPNLRVERTRKSRVSYCHYSFRYRLINTGSGDIIGEDFSVLFAFFESGKWIITEKHIHNHQDFDLDADSISDWYSFEFDTPAHLSLWKVTADFHNEIDESNEKDNNKFRISFFI